MAIEGDLPLTAIDIESQKDMKSGRSHPLRSLDKWFAARPTPAARLSVLASTYPGEIDADELLSLMQIGQKEQTEEIAEYVQRKYAKKSEKKSGNENLDEYYGYPNPQTQTPTNAGVQHFYDQIRDGWGGNLPTILDPTAGRGIIPFEGLRYGLPVKANELNPIPVLISKVALEYAPEVGSVTPEIYTWTERIKKETQNRTSEYYPTKESERQILNSAMTYIVTCDSCGAEIPLTGKWWINKDRSGGGDAVRPQYEDSEVSYKHINMDQNNDFDPSDAPVSSGGSVECPHCTVPMDPETIREKFRNNEFEYSVYGVNYISEGGEWKWRAGGETDKKGMEKAEDRIDSDFEMLEFFSEHYPGGNTDRVENYGVSQWRDLFTPRQLVTHYELFQVFEECKQEIIDAYTIEKAELYLILLAMAIDRQVQYNTRLSTWKDTRGVVQSVFRGNNFTIKRMFGENNICAPRRGLERRFGRVIDDSYEKIAAYVDDRDSGEVFNQDAAKLTKQMESNSVDVAVVDPPYFDSVMYGELSDLPYLSKKRLLGDVFPQLFESELTAKEEQAVANPARQDNPEEFYEEKMKSIFNKLKDVLVNDGVLTLMFTDREVQAWNTISKAVIESGFTITASHPIKTEMSDRAGAQDTASVSSSILLISRNSSEKAGENVLWEDIKSEIEETARIEAQRLLSIDDINKVDTSIAAFGPALERYSEAYPVEDKHGDKVEPKRVLAKARQEVTNVIANDELSTETNPVEGLTRWYILCYTIYGEADIPFDEANQLGIGADVEITDIKRPTKIWSKSRGDVDLNDHTDRVQDIVKLRDDRADNPSSRKYPVDPTETTFTYAIDAVHAALHVYEREGSQFTRDWLAERGSKNNRAFTTTVRALLEAVPSDTQMHDTLTDMIAGETGDYLDISVSDLSMTDGGQTQTGLEEFE